jgi:hypothetical protein
MLRRLLGLRQKAGRPRLVAPMSRIDRVAPDAGAGAHEQQLGRFRLAWPTWLPRTVLVTAGLTLLTAWLFPALTHQWQDRQKARELSAGLVTQVGKETSQALVTSDFFSGGRPPFVLEHRFNQRLFNQLDLDWRKRERGDRGRASNLLLGCNG